MISKPQHESRKLKNMPDEIKTLLARHSASIIEKIDAAIAALDCNGTFVFVNEGFCDLLGYSPAELIGKSYVEFTKQEDIAADRTNRQLIKDGAVSEVRFVKTYITKAGKQIAVKVHLLGLRSNGKFEGFATFSEEQNDAELKARLDVVEAKLLEMVEERKNFFAFLKKNWLIIVIILWILLGKVNAVDMQSIVKLANPVAELVAPAVPIEGN